MHLLGGIGTAGHAEDLALTSGGDGVLSSHSVAPVVTNTSVGSDLLQALNVSSDSGNQHVNNALGGLSSDEVSLSVHEPIRDLELLGVGDDGNELLDLFVRQGAGSAVQVNLRFLAKQVSETLSNSNNLAQGKHGLALAVNVGVQHTKNVLKLSVHLQTLLMVVKKKNEINEWLDTETFRRYPQMANRMI